MGFEVFHRKVDLGLKQARKIIDGAMAEARRLSLQPMAVVVLDAGGNVVSADVEDGAGILRFDLAIGKAAGGLGFGASSSTMTARTTGRETFVSGVAAAAQGRFVPAGGGVLLLDDDDTIIGAVGASGDSPDNDEVCVHAGIDGAGMRPGFDAAEA
ncbi:MAG: heme-binding protein [Halofilum sp. (in: g-proteobacteria)]